MVINKYFVKMESLFKISMPSEITEELIKVLYSGNLTSGEYVKKFEYCVSKYIGNQNFVAVNSYSSAASIVWDLIGLDYGDEVIASPMSCLASNQPIIMKKAVIKWTDIDPLVGSLDPTMIRKNITPKTKAILHYHWGGYPGHIDEILEIGREYGIPIVEDAIESFGSEYKGKKIGNTGADYSLFSFQTVRLPNTIDGGGLICKREADYQKAILLRDYGIDRLNFRDYLGEIKSNCDIFLPASGATLNEIGALIGYKSMDVIISLLKKQQENALSNKLFLEQFKSIQHIGLKNTLPNYWIYTFLSNNRDNLLQEIREIGLYASKVHLRNDYYSVFGKFCPELKGVEKFNDETLSIPCGWWINNK